MTFKQWAGALYVATLWEFEDTRAYIIRVMSKLFQANNDPLGWIDAAIKCRVPEWLITQYQALCERPSPLTTEEITRLGFQKSASIARIRDMTMRGTATKRHRELVEDDPHLKMVASPAPEYFFVKLDAPSAVPLKEHPRHYVTTFMVFSVSAILNSPSLI